MTTFFFQDGREQRWKFDRRGVLEGLPPGRRAVEDARAQRGHVDGTNKVIGSHKGPGLGAHLRMCTCERDLRRCIFMYFSAFNPQKVGAG